MAKWPWKDGEAAKLRRIVESYRVGLGIVDPYMRRVIDARMAEYGEAWLAGDVDVNDELTVEEIYSLLGAGFEPHLIQEWARAGGISPTRFSGGKSLYRLGDVVAYQAGA